MSHDECDIPEVCDGESSESPRDVYKHDGASCGVYGSEFCYKGYCGTYEDHCYHLFGQKENGDYRCYLFNHRHPTGLTNCGPDAVAKPESGRYIACSLEDMYCGKILCNSDTPSRLLSIENRK